MAKCWQFIYLWLPVAIANILDYVLILCYLFVISTNKFILSYIATKIRNGGFGVETINCSFIQNVNLLNYSPASYLRQQTLVIRTCFWCKYFLFSREQYILPEPTWICVFCGRWSSKFHSVNTRQWRTD